jgi:hypothetical protein
MAFHLLVLCSLFLFSPSHLEGNADGNTIRSRIYARGEVSFAKFIFLPSWFAKLLKDNFSRFAKIRWMPS